MPAAAVGKAMDHRDLGHAILLTGERVRLVRPDGEGPRGAYLEVDLEGLADDEDPESFAAFYRLFHASQFSPGANGELPINGVEERSRQHAQKVSDDLKRAVFTAAETLADGLLADAAARGAVTRPPATREAELRLLRDAALTALYRILFILYAEARDPRLAEHALYLQAYSIHGLVEQILQDPGHDHAENRVGLWSRLKALFRIFDRGLQAVSEWEQIPPRGGDFFHETTAAGRLLADARLPDRTVARLLLDLTTAAPRRGVGRDRVSFRELDIENLGAVYEGLLEFEPRVASAPVLEVSVQGRSFILAPEEVARLCEVKKLVLRGDFALVSGTAAERLHPEGADDNEEEEEQDEEVGLEEQSDADDEDGADGEAAEDAEAGIRPGSSARLVRRLEPGRFHFVSGGARKGSGPFYTPLPLVRDLVEHALGPAARGKSVAEIERLRVVDPACGSAHFLVEAMRFLGQELHRAYVREHRGKTPPGFRATAGGSWDDACAIADAEARAANSEARAWCKRRIAERCLYGVDLNPTAVELARVALWIESMAGDRPLTYFQHHVRYGNSLLGTWLDRLDRPPLPDMPGADQPAQLGLFAKSVRDRVGEAARIRAQIDRADAESLAREGIEPDSVREQDFKDRQRRRAEEVLAGARLVFDLRSASAFVPEIWNEWAGLYGGVQEPAQLEAYARRRPWWSKFEEVRARERFFHWELEFPEALLDPARAGFDAVLGNPPWDKVLPAKHEFYARQDVLIRAYKGGDLDRRIAELHAAHPGLAGEFEAYRERTTRAAKCLRNGGDFPLAEARSQAAHEDVSKYFLDRAVRLAAPGGRVGFVVPSVMYNGDGCVGLRRFLLEQATVERFYGFENRAKQFPIDSRYKFVSLVFCKSAPTGDGFDAAFMRHDLAELSDDGAKPWVVRVTRSEVERFSPETLAFLELRGPRDLEIVRKMHAGRPTLGGDGPGAWGVKMFTDMAHMQIYNGARDKDLFTDPATGRLYTPTSVLGKEPENFGETLRDMRAKGFWPVFEGKHVDQFVVGIKPVRWWVSLAQAEAKYGKRPRSEPTLVFRETASNTNERTCIAAMLPTQSVASHKLTGVLLENVRPECALSVLNSLCFDYALRMRTAGINVSFTYMRPMPVPPADVVNQLPTLPTLLAWEAGGAHVANREDLWPKLWEINRAVAEAYGLDAEDFRYLLDAFPGMAKKREPFVEHIRERLDGWR